MKIIQFTKLRFISFPFSIIVFLFCLYQIIFVHKSFATDIDFSGGLNIIMQANVDITLDKTKDIFQKYDIPAAIVQIKKNTETLLKIEVNTEGEERIQTIVNKNDIETSDGSIINLKYLLSQELEVEIESIEFVSVSQVGPTVGRDLFRSSVFLLLLALVLITIYIMFRFRVSFAVGATVALLHDAFLTVLLIGMLQIPLSIPIIAAILAILGYSINDTIVIFDRIRENISKEEGIPLSRVINVSILQSLTRTIITSVTTLLVVFAIYLYAGENLKPMSSVLIIGIIIGTYSSSFIAAPVLLFFKKSIA